MAANGRKNAETLALALAAGDSITDAAAKAGMSERTAYRRRADPTFRQRVEQLRAEMIGRAMGRMADSMTEAANALRALLSAQSESVRLGACRAMLELGVKLREAVEFEARLAELERVQSISTRKR